MQARFKGCAIMNETDAWTAFASTGSVKDYLQYVTLKNTENSKKQQNPQKPTSTTQTQPTINLQGEVKG
ncbi:hypothetical protein AGMMS50284_0850 [Clostridia bacterium]|nr:hypothetical protein AGMMS50284_0850 [Clostridia bacterium]